MPIGVSFTGFDGKKKSAVVKSTDELQRFMGGSKPSVGQQFKFEKPDPVDGPLIGIEGNGVSEPDGQSRPVGAAGGWRIPITRTEMSVKPSLEMKCNKVTLTKLEYDLIISEKGFVKGRTVERKVWEKSFFVLSEQQQDESKADGKWCCRMFYTDVEEDKVHPIPTYLAFGTESNLDTYNKAKDRFECNYVSEDSDELVDDPPVKVVQIEAGAVPAEDEG